jgi:hypothetical protein
MSDQFFDKKIRESLENLEVPFDPSSWDAFERKLDAATPAEVPDRGAALDDALRQRLADAAPTYEPAHWQLLSARLDSMAHIRRIRKHKVAEAAIMLLLLANLQAFFEGGTRLFHMPMPSIQPTEAEQPIARARQRGQGHQAQSGMAANIQTADAPTGLTTENQTYLFENQTLTTLGADLAKQYAYEDSIIQAIERQTGVRLPLTISRGLIGPDGRPVAKGLRPLTLLAALGLGPLDHQRAMQPIAGLAPTESAPRKHRDRTGRWFLQGMVAWESNRTRIPDDNPEKAFADRQSGVATGLAVGTRRGKWTAEAGIAYAQRGYGTAKEIFSIKKDDATGNFIGTTFAEVEGRLVSVPVKVTRQLARAGRVRVAATAGATGHFAAHKTYRFEEHPYPTSPSSQGNPVPTPAADGLLQGGSVDRNFYATADLGVRVEYPMSRRAVAYVEPAIRQPIAGHGFGPKAARTRSVGVSAGVMATL